MQKTEFNRPWSGICLCQCEFSSRMSLPLTFSNLSELLLFANILGSSMYMPVTQHKCVLESYISICKARVELGQYLLPPSTFGRDFPASKDFPESNERGSASPTGAKFGHESDTSRSHKLRRQRKYEFTSTCHRNSSARRLMYISLAPSLTNCIGNAR
jgi:hypothetical protein